MLFLYWRKCHFSSYSYIPCLIKDPAERLKIYVYFENSQTGSRSPFDSPEGWAHHKICLAIFGLVLGAFWKQKNWPCQQGGPGNRKKSTKIMPLWHFQNWPLGLVLPPREVSSTFKCSSMLSPVMGGIWSKISLTGTPGRLHKCQKLHQRKTKLILTPLWSPQDGSRGCFNGPNCVLIYERVSTGQI